MAIEVLADVVRTHAASQPDKDALLFGDRRWSYAGLADESARVAQALLAEGVAPQDHVAVLDKNAPEYFTFLFGAAMVNAVTLAVNWRLAPPEMEYILNDAEARVLLVGEEFLGHLEKMKLETVRKVVVVGAAGDLTPYEEWIGAHDPVDPKVPSAPGDTCYQLYTSGTTGLPKGVELTNRNLLSAMRVGAVEWSFDTQSVNLVAMPLFHIAGSGWGIAGFHCGGPNILLRDIDPGEILRVVPEHRVTNALFVPAVLQVLISVPGAADADFSSVRSIVYGASPISEPVLVGAMQAFGCGFVQVYGLTETTGAISALPPQDHDPGGPRAELLRSAGRPWGDVQVRIVDAETGKDVTDGQVGEIWIRSAQNMRGYWKNEQATAEAYPEGRDADGIGWFRSGDAGFLKDGYVFIHDRVKDMIVSGAENVYPAEIENVLMGHDAVADAAVIGVPSEKWGETVKAIVVPAAGADFTDDDLIAYCRERLAHYKCPTSVDRVEALPRNPSGKILKTELREPYWKGHTRRVN
ncbi:MAG: long-chain-fatty-acid--CoA ligase [Myxococcota bacterium]